MVVARDDVVPVPLAQRGRGKVNDSTEFELRLRLVQRLGPVLDLALRQLAALLVLNRGENAERAILPGRQDGVLRVVPHARGGGAVAVAFPQQPRAAIVLVEDPHFDRVVAAGGKQDRLSLEEAAGAHLAAAGCGLGFRV